jgi:chromosome segregation ATPase
MSIFKNKSDAINSSHQQAGFLLKLPFRKQVGKWQKRWFICKGSFILYYGSSKPKKENLNKFDVHPKGVIPLGNVHVEEHEPTTPPPKGFSTFKVTHPDFGCGALVLAAESEEKRREWMDTIGDCSRITQENALLGASMIERLTNKSSELEAEHELALAKYQQEALRLRQEKEAFEQKEAEHKKHQQELEKIDLGIAKSEQAIKELATAKSMSEAQLRAQEEEAKKLVEANLRAEKEADRLAMEREQAESAMDEVEKQALLLQEQKALAELQLQETGEEAARREEEALEQLEEIKAAGDGVDEQLDLERRRRLKAQKKLEAAGESLKRLEAALSSLEGQERVDADADVKKLKDFFSKRIDQEKKKAALTATMKKAVTAAKIFKKHSLKISVEHR